MVFCISQLIDIIDAWDLSKNDVIPIFKSYVRISGT